MRTLALSIFLAAGLAIPAAVGAQFLFPEMEPRVDAAQEQWQINGDPLVLDGIVYYPTGATRFFDPNVMVRTGVYRGIPLYQDRTIEPYSIVYVPIGRRMMRPYERRRTGELAGTVGSRTPGFPVSSASAGEDRSPNDTATTAVGTTGSSAADGNTYVGAAGVVITNAQSPTIAATVAPAVADVQGQRGRAETIPGPSGPDGIYIEFSGGRWYNSGAPAAYSAQAFTPIGNYAGFVVYRMNDDSSDRVWVPVVEGGPLAQYSRR